MSLKPAMSMGAVVLLLLAACEVDLLSSRDGTSVTITYQLSGGIAGSFHEVVVYEQGKVKVTLRGIPRDADFVRSLTSQQHRELKSAVATAVAQIHGNHEPALPPADDFALSITIRDVKRKTEKTYTASAMYDAPEGYQQLQKTFEALIVKLTER